MKNRRDRAFKKRFACLPSHVQEQAKIAFGHFKHDIGYSGLHFEYIHKSFCAVRIGLHYRAVGQKEGDTITWFWIGSHEEYNHLLDQL